MEHLESAHFSQLVLIFAIFVYSLVATCITLVWPHDDSLVSASQPREYELGPGRGCSVYLR